MILLKTKNKENKNHPFSRTTTLSFYSKKNIQFCCKRRRSLRLFQKRTTKTKTKRQNPATRTRFPPLLDIKKPKNRSFENPLCPPFFTQTRFFPPKKTHANLNLFAKGTFFFPKRTKRNEISDLIFSKKNFLFS